VSGFRVEITDRCEGHGRCYDHAPDLFRPDDDGFGVVVNTEIGEDLGEAARFAALACPERAIEVEPVESAD
jgi:ferredoxin